MSILDPLSQHKHVFVAGLHRSGTSLLAELLGSLPEVSGFVNTDAPHNEGQFLQTVFTPARDYGGPGKFGFSTEMHLTEVSPLFNEENRQRLIKEWYQYWDLSKTCLLEKSPPNLLKMRFLQAIFPNSYFIVIMRHPVANAYATSKWSGTKFRQLVKHWLVCHDIYRSDKPHLGKVYELKYERFVQEPTDCFHGILNFIDLAQPLDRSEEHTSEFYRLSSAP
ncbi:MAG: sulfotransferase [Anaerolineales bacterium]|nr:sulfotransferase [Anaerolineales bacterium]